MVKLVDGNYVDGYGDLVWVERGEFHRADGPAILFGQGQEILGSDFIWPADKGKVSWWWRGTGHSFEHWLKLNHKLSEEEKVMMKLKYG